jgi:hypothetical protein
MVAAMTANRIASVHSLKGLFFFSDFLNKGYNPNVMIPKSITNHNGFFPSDASFFAIINLNAVNKCIKTTKTKTR